MSATLGLAHLAAGNLDKGMKLYRDAADLAEEVEPTGRSLMALYQAVFVCQGSPRRSRSLLASHASANSAPLPARRRETAEHAQVPGANDEVILALRRDHVSNSALQRITLGDDVGRNAGMQKSHHAARRLVDF
ncbi:hypothetical protein PDG61_21095 [Mycolicibacterium sp. BiH015]|uniref:hypothetical protein n=1 Tax=Mycolicibacterium sp. BiH015 TaxID=3018808 RepID=UPI0022E50766|nr:hypothetical protein [Mycolicibacterium sp. BiH015]MDA2893425.1 hypothetical protein [Mycolicibacterium sp. BiH015]